MSFLDQRQLGKFGFKSIGENVQISEKVSIYGAGCISIGNNVRIDDFCVLSAGKDGITIGSHVHIAAYSLLCGRESIVLDDFSGLSSRVSLYSSTDDYLGNALTNPTVPSEFTSVRHGKVHLRKHAIIGAGSVILPGVVIGEGSAVGALSLVNRIVPAFSIVGGVPARVIKERKRGLLELERQFKRSLALQADDAIAQARITTA